MFNITTELNHQIQQTQKLELALGANVTLSQITEVRTEPSEQALDAVIIRMLRGKINIYGVKGKDTSYCMDGFHPCQVWHTPINFVEVSIKEGTQALLDELACESENQEWLEAHGFRPYVGMDSENESNAELLEEQAFEAYKNGQFEIAQSLYEEAEDSRTSYF